LSGPGKTAKELRQGRGSGNIEANFRSGDARGIHRQSSNPDDNRSGDIGGDQMCGGGLVAKVAGLAIRAVLSAMIMPNAAANQRENEQKPGDYGAELYGSNCAVLVHN
jgi:hypothetical protein